MNNNVFQKWSPCHPFPLLCCIWRSLSLMSSSGSLKQGQPGKSPSWRSWILRTNESAKPHTHTHKNYIIFNVSISTFYICSKDVIKLNVALTLCWKKDGSRYLSNLSSNFTSDFFHFTCEDCQRDCNIIHLYERYL